MAATRASSGIPGLRRFPLTVSESSGSTFFQPGIDTGHVYLEFVPLPFHDAIGVDKRHNPNRCSVQETGRERIAAMHWANSDRVANSIRFYTNHDAWILPEPWDIRWGSVGFPTVGRRVASRATQAHAQGSHTR
jgi:hypothetical protein